MTVKNKKILIERAYRIISEAYPEDFKNRRRNMESGVALFIQNQFIKKIYLRWPDKYDEDVHGIWLIPTTWYTDIKFTMNNREEDFEEGIKWIHDDLLDFDMFEEKAKNVIKEIYKEYLKLC